MKGEKKYTEMKLEKFWDEQIKNWYNDDNVIPGYFNDIIESIENKKDFSIDNFTIYTVLCGGTTFIQFHKKQIASITRNYQKNTYSITISSDLKEMIKNAKIEYEEILVKDLLFMVAIKFLGISEETIKSYQTNPPKPCELGYYKFPNGELEFA